MGRSSDAQRVEAIDRALQVLLLLAERETLSVTEVSREMGVSLSTAHRILGTLRHRGFARQDASRAYVIGPVATGIVAADSTLRVCLRPTLQNLHDRINETVHLAVPVGAEVYVADGIERHSSEPRAELRVGCHGPAYATATGMAILAAMDPEQVKRLHSSGLLPWPRVTAWSLEQIEEQLPPIRERGYATSFQVFEPGAVTLGAAILGPSSDPVAGIAASVTINRYTPARGERIGASLITAAREGAAALAGASPGDLLMTLPI
jgi:DNA-binding IclR family transcriptional regulator